MSKLPRTTLYLLITSSLLVFVIGGNFACKLWTIRPIESKSQKSNVATQAFNADAYVDSIWESKLLPVVLEKAIDLPTLLTALDANAEAAKKQYGLRYDEGATHFIVKGEAVIIRANEQSPQRTLTIKPANYQGKTEIVLQVGPVFRGTALRDAVGFIKFNDFGNQLQYAEVSTKLHERVTDKVIREFHVHDGAKVSFYAAFTLNDPKKILLTPVKYEYLGGGRV